MKYTLAVAAATLAVASLSTAAIAAPERLRGTVTSVTADAVMVHTADKDLTVSLSGNTKYIKVVKSSLDNVAKDSFIGTATKEVGGKLIALEVVVFPPEMKGTGEGHYGWDRIADTTVAGGGATGSMMTNGTVATVASGATANTSMTNGTVATTDGKGGAKQITVTYKGGEQSILVPPTAPIVGFVPDTMADLTKGKVVFVIASNDDGKLAANAVIIGSEGVPPPM